MITANNRILRHHQYSTYLAAYLIPERIKTKYLAFGLKWKKKIPARIEFVDLHPLIDKYNVKLVDPQLTRSEFHKIITKYIHEIYKKCEQ